MTSRTASVSGWCAALSFSIMLFLTACGGGGGSTGGGTGGGGGTTPPPSTANEWTWVSGGNSSASAGAVYGTQGVAAVGNVPGARGDAVGWTDSSGNLWLFGGDSFDSNGNDLGDLNDLWEFSPATREWTWVSGSNSVNAQGVYGTLGVPSATNVPGARTSPVSWTDKSGNLWLFGGNGLDPSNGNGDYLNDLWEFNPASKQWTWISGSSTANAQGVYGTQGVAAASNVPGARGSAVSWMDSSGNFWLFGGINLNSTGVGDFLNDLWEFDPTSKQWTWISGSSTGGALGVYGTQGVASASNVPGARVGAVGWTDSSGNLWLFGGQLDGNLVNDLWEFNPSQKEWTWVGGSNTIQAPGVYGTQGVAAASNVPGARVGAVGWTDNSGNLWLFGGSGLTALQGNSSPGDGSLNDLWEFNTTTKEWTWVGGSNTINQPGVYGTLDVASASNTPGARVAAAAWTDSSGNFWLFGGMLFGLSAAPNDLWRYQP